MKNILFLLVTFLSISLTTQANTIDYEKPDITVTDQFDVDLLQVATDIPIEANYNHCKGFDVFNLTSDRYITSITASRYSENIDAIKQINLTTTSGKKQICYSIIKQSRQRDTSGMRVQGAEGSCENLQGDYYNPEGNKYTTKGNLNGHTKPNEFYSKAILLDRAGIGIAFYRIDRCKICSALHT